MALSYHPGQFMLFSLIGALRTLLRWLDFIILSAILYILSWIPQKIRDYFYPQLFQYWCRVFSQTLGVTLKYHQQHILPLPQQFILISNHPSVFEDIGMPALFKVKFLAKQQVKDWWIVGRISTAAGTLYFDRENKVSRKKVIDMLKRQLAQGHNIGLYPEGGCKGRRLSLPFKHGAFELSFQSKVPIVPVFLHYEAQQDFEWYQQSLIQKIWQITQSQNRTANYYIYDPIFPENFSDPQALGAHIEKLYQQWQTQHLI